MDSASPEAGAFLTARVRDQLEELNAYVAERRLRRYQAELARGGRLRFPDPRNGVLTHCSGTIFHVAKSFSYRFCGPAGEFWLMTSEIAAGYALDGLYLRPEGVFIPLHERMGDAQGRLRVDLVERCAPEPAAAPAGTCMVLGHPNFAHFVWNELAALLALGTEDFRVAETRVIYEPMLPITLLADVFDETNMVRSLEMDLHSNKPHCHPQVLFAPGSEFINSETKARVVGSCARYSAPAPGEVPGRETFNLWISLRLLYRRALNEEEALGRLIRSQLEKHPEMTVMLDGYSLPFDIGTQFRYRTEAQLDEAARVVALARRLIDGLPAMLADRIHDLTAMSLPTAIAAASVADFYVCHHGTQQHKIGWFHDVPGIIHANVEVLRSQPAEWVRAQSEGAVRPIYVPVEMVENTDDPRNARAGDPYFGDYRFVDAAALAEFADPLIAEALADWRARQTARRPGGA